ncbi:hypothetical protein E8E13_003744 [Curvularia kusanoi]|uniref:Uncharacterized protein n=1 Tax=Curvularia kusanoi TaxID=90978 RepID=A0A9P4WAS0_CURKU|nr:hypothetical protein E8E13_003744 [Curvularia kusanoi]
MKPAIWASLLCLTAASSYYHSPPADGALVPSIDALIQYTTSRNHETISKAVEFLASMETASTCTRTAVSNIINECKHFEGAPGFEKGQSDAYLDNVKKDYAAKLAVCEWLGAQPPDEATPPPNCNILVPSSRACSKSTWWSRTPVNSNRLCYPEYTDSQFKRCFESLRAKSQHWTSYSNAGQNVVVMCQASRDAIERENHLEIFKNLTQVMGDVSSFTRNTTEAYASLLREQTRFADELREAQAQLKQDASAAQVKALSTVSELDDKFQNLISTSIVHLRTALADGQTAELIRIREKLQAFSLEMIVDTSQLVNALRTELQQHHDRAIDSLESNHHAQVHSYGILSGYMNDITEAANRINATSGKSLTIMDNMETRLDILSSKAETIFKGFAFFSSLSRLAASFVRGSIATIGAITILISLYRFSARLATYLTGACSAAYFLYFCGVYEFLAESHRSPSFLHHISNLNTTQKGVLLVMTLWLATYPVSRISTAINDIFIRILSSYWVREYRNEGGTGYLLSVEIPQYTTHSKIDTLEQGIATGHNRLLSTEHRTI